MIAILYFSVPICLQITSTFQAKIRIRFGHVWTCSRWRKTFQVYHMWEKICNSQQSISSYTEKTFLCLRTWNSARIKTSSYLRSMLVFAEIKIRFSEPRMTFTFISTIRSWSLSYSNMAKKIFDNARVLASCSKLRIRHDFENAKFWPGFSWRSI